MAIETAALLVGLAALRRSRLGGRVGQCVFQQTLLSFQSFFSLRISGHPDLQLSLSFSIFSGDCLSSLGLCCSHGAHLRAATFRES